MILVAQKRLSVFLSHFFADSGLPCLSPVASKERPCDFYYTFTARQEISEPRKQQICSIQFNAVVLKN